MKLGLKIDVDTYRGMKEGVPRLLDILARYQIRATFFLSFGPDASGLALFQLIRNPRFWYKILYSSAPRLYGWKTALYGTILPSPMIALSFPHLVKRIEGEGHEIALHAWDHRRWQDSLSKRSEEWIRSWFEKGVQAFCELLGRLPHAFGAPGWIMDERALGIAVAVFSPFYLSSTRAREPFIYKGFGVLEIPSDLPCIEEVGIGGLRSALERMMEDDDERWHVLPVHAEVEGGIWAGEFEHTLQRLLGVGTKFCTLKEIAEKVDRTKLTHRRPEFALLPGRAFPCLV